MKHGGDKGAHRHTQNGVGKGGEKIGQPRLVLQGHNGGGHGVHADEENAGAQEDLADILLAAAFDKHEKDDADDRHHRPQYRGLKEIQNSIPAGNTGQPQDLRRNGGTDVGPHNDAHRLLQLHDAGIDEAHAHDGGGSRRVDDGGDQRPQKHALKDVVGQFFQYALQPAAGQLGQTVGHGGHTKEEQGDGT